MAQFRLLFRPWLNRSAHCCKIARCAVLAAIALLATLGASRASAGGGPQNVVLVINPNDEDSLTVGNHYAALRDIPGQNVIQIEWRLNRQRMTGKAFSDNLIRPILTEIKQRGLEEQIDYIVYSCGFPYAVDFSKGFDGAGEKPTDRPLMSLNSATYLYSSILRRQMEAFSIASNNYYSRPAGGKSSSRAFTATQRWGSRGQPVERGGNRYYLSTMLSSAFGRGNTVDEIVNALKLAKQADGTRPQGTIYYMRNNNVRSRTRHDTFAGAVVELQQLGVSARIVNGRQPNNRLDIAGLTTGYTHVNVRASGGRFVPGALVDNLTSAGGQLQVNPRNPNPQTPVSQYLREGAVGASGTVIEPFAIAQKFPDAYLHVHYARGCSLAEAFYQSVHGPYQLLIVGDPLCRPWAKIPLVSVAGVTNGATVAGMLKVTPTADVEGGARVRQFQAFVDGALVASCDSGGDLSIDTTKLADGWRRLAIVAIDDSPIAVQGEWSGIVEIRNGFGVVQISAPSAVAVGDTFTVAVRATEKGATHVYHLGREIGVVDESEGKLRLDTRGLGRGPVRFEAQQTGDVTIHARPLVVNVH